MMKQLMRILATGLLLGVVIAAPRMAGAAMFVVDSESEDPDASPGDGICATVAHRCSLRAAVEEANSHVGSDEVVVPKGDFDLRASGLVVADDLVLSGAGPKATRLLARNRESVIRIVGSPVVAISGMRLEGGRADRGAGIDNPSGTLTLTDVALLFNRASSGVGGALFNGGAARLERVTMTGNVARAGGAIYNDISGELQVIDTTLRRNRHRVPGGGGCLYNAGDAQVDRSLFARCQGRIGDGGGGILNRGTLALSNSTLWGCRARLGQGGAIVNDVGALMQIDNSTVIRNQAAFVGGGLVNYGSASIRNSIVWGNVSRARDANCGGLVPLLSLGNNIDGGDSCGFGAAGDFAGTDPKIGRDNDNGGPTRTREIRAGSPAVDAIDSDWCPATDQRGEPRPADGDGDGQAGCDIGAFECGPAVATASAFVADVPEPGIEAPEFQANTQAQAHQQAPVAASLPEGELLLVWQAGPGQDGDGEGIFAQRFDALGNRLGEEVRLNDNIDGDQTAPALAVANGVVVAAWESLATRGGAEQAIIVRRFDRYGSALGDERRVDTAGGIAAQPAVALAPDGSASIAWIDGPADADGIFLGRVPVGASLPPPVEVDPQGTRDPGAPSVAAGPAGTRMVVWSGERDDRAGVFARLFGADDVPLSEPFAVWHAESNLPDLPTASVASDAAGRFVVAWQIPGEGVDGERDVIVAQRFGAGGEALGDRISVSRSALGYRARPRVAVSPGGHSLVVWESETGDDLSGGSVMARRLDEFGKPLGGEFRVSTRSLVYQAEANVAAHDNGAFQVVWSADAQDGDGLGVFGHTTALEGYVGYRAKEAAADGNRLPRHFNVNLDDLVIPDGSADDGENYTIGRVRSLLLSSRVRSGEVDASRPAYVRYAVKPADEGAGDADKDRLPRVVQHLPRRWEVDNRFGTLVVESRRASALLMPATVSGEPLPDATAPGYLCYQIKPMAGEMSTQLAGSSFRPDLQVFAGDGFDDCAQDKSGAVSFATTAVAGKCLYQIRKPVELCNPVAVGNVAPPRTTSADIVPVPARPGASLLCYQVKTATRVNSADASVQIGRRGQLNPPQLRHERHLARFGSALSLLPPAGMASPFLVDTLGSERLCLPTRIRDIAALQ
jgi:hypothetical protein